MSSSRREFLKRGSWAAVAAGVSLGVTEKASAKGAAAETTNGSSLSLAAFKSALNTTFVINNGNSKVNLKLINVKDLASSKQRKNGKEGFSLLFNGSDEAMLRQNTYLIEHDKLGMFSFLMVPTKIRNKTAPHYEVVVNRLYP